MKRIHELANYVGEAYTAGHIPEEQAHHIISELTIILAQARFAERDHAADIAQARADALRGVLTQRSI